MNKIVAIIVEIIEAQIGLFTGQIDYYEYSKLFRRKDMLIFQFLLVFGFLLVGGLLIGIPYYVILGAIPIIIYGFILQSKAHNWKQQLLYSFIWASTSFIAIIVILFVAVGVFGFVK